MNDIQVDGVYAAEVAYRRSGKVRVVEKRARHARPRDQRRTDGVRVVLEEPIRSIIESECRDAGTELVVPSRKISHAWTQEDQDALEHARSEESRKQRVEELLERAGYTQDGYSREARDFVEGDFTWRGEWLLVRGELCEELMSLLADTTP